MKTVTFKSTPEMWDKEFRDVKRNTVRRFSQLLVEEEREITLLKFMNGEIDELHIQLINTNETYRIFSRQVTDVTFWEGFYIISW